MMAVSSSSEGELEIDVGDIDDSICIVCNSSTYVGETIACETCQLWFHFPCVGVKPGDDVVEKEDVPFFCPTCVKRKSKAGPTGGAAGRNSSRKRKIKAPPTAPPPPAASKPAAKRSVGRPKKTAAPPPTSSAPAAAPLPSPPIKLKINLGKGKASVSQTTTQPASTSSSSSLASSKRPREEPPAAEASRKRPRVETPNSEEEEERWLDEVEAGKDGSAVDSELKSIKDPRLMTARQRAMVERQKAGGGEELTLEETGHMALDYGYKKKAPPVEMDEEDERLKAIKSAKRKEIEQEKREQDKKRTMDKLLKKKDTKVSKHIKTAKESEDATGAESATAATRPKRDYPVYSYKISVNGKTISVPDGFKFPLEAKGPAEPPKPILCSVAGCQNPRAYSCSKTGKPLCSLSCYKINLGWERNKTLPATTQCR